MILNRFKFLYFDVKLFIKSTWQRLTKGFAYKDTWSLDYSLAKWILPRLRHFRNTTNSTPFNLETPGADNQNYLTIEEWRGKLDAMIYSFEFVLTEDDIILKSYPENYNWKFKSIPEENGASRLEFEDKRKPNYAHYNTCVKRYEEGMRLFSLYFRNLWD